MTYSTDHRVFDDDATIAAFFEAGPWAVAGASTNRAKYGNMVLRSFLQNGREAYPINPRADQIEGVQAFASLAALPTVPHGVSIITPPKITEQIVDEAIALGARHVWMQPGAESRAAIDRAVDAGLGVIAGGPCVLVVQGFSWAGDDG